MADPIIRKRKITDYKPDPHNANRGTERGQYMLDRSVEEVGAARSLVAAADDTIPAGNKSLQAFVDAGLEDVIEVETDGTTPVVVKRTDWASVDDERARKYAYFDNRASEVGLAWDADQVLADLNAGVDLSALWHEDELAALLASLEIPDERNLTTEQARQTLAERFIVPPFSVLDARQGYWQARKRAWLALGIQSEIAREVRGRNVTSGKNSAMHRLSGRLAAPEALESGGSTVSIFDPVLCELAYRWFCPSSGAVLDPFAGGSVRGIVAARLGRRYVGIDLRPEQVEANRQQAEEITPDELPRWMVGDSRDLEKHLRDSEQFDFVFTCPPYFDLEIYSDDPGDLSNAEDYAAFMADYCAIIALSVARLKPDRFACVVVGDIRDKQGLYRNFVSDTIAAFQDAGAALYNEAILVTAVGSLPIRVGKQFESGRKLGKTHQNVLVFVKGEPRAAVQAIGPVEAGDLSQDDAPIIQ